MENVQTSFAFKSNMKIENKVTLNSVMCNFNAVCSFCSIDLKEAVTSVMFAAHRCSAIPELVDAKKNFTAKYGKGFHSRAIELHLD
ncbi:hypothetical protein L1987_17878 [Smallanthus sonchifolius]|uniref:Uncharacterized protein n=1 Tax=Smallanthus sonchifolius TaxID=185202 RepID=A0ACB9J085_9ASTR|nr:hypothetical protein L1987_17878 [Smallanthus sonchifolius]